MKIPTFVILALLIATHAMCADTWTAPVVHLFAGHTADVITTRLAINRGCAEGNTFIYGSKYPSNTRLIATKSVAIGATLGAAWTLNRMGHPTAAKTILHFGGLAGDIPAVMNVVVECKERRGW